MSGHDDFAFEPVPGLPERLPGGEEMLWQGRPATLALAREAMGLNWVAGYFLRLAFWRFGTTAAEAGLGRTTAVTVTDTDTEGNVVLDLDHGGFIAVLQNGLDRARKVRRVDANVPVRLVRFANGRLAIIDPATGWSAELGAFGSDNRAAFERLIKN